MSMSKEKLKRQIEQLIEKLEAFGLDVFENDIAEDEEAELKKQKKGFNFFVFETGDITKIDDSKTVSQDVIVYYYSENEVELDEKVVDIITALSAITNLHFKNSVKQRLRKKETDQYVDLVVFNFTRAIKLGCVLT